MSEWFRAGGVMMWPILAAALLVVGAAVAEARKLRSGAGDDEIGVVLAWGGLAAVFGVLGTLVGVVQMASAVQRVAGSGGVAPGLLWGGLRVTLITSIFGFCVLGLSLLAWFGLRALRTSGDRVQTPA